MHKWFENDTLDPYIGVDLSIDLISKSAQICAKIAPLVTWTVLDPFSGSKLTSDTPKCFKNAFSNLGTSPRSNACAVHIFLIFSDSWNPFTSIQSTWLQFLFWSFWSHLSSAGFPHSSLSCYLLLYIIFLVCHLSISLPRGQDDYIIELNFNSSWILSTWGILFPSYVLVTWGISSLGASCSPLSGIFFIYFMYFIYFICWSADQIL